MTNQKGKDTMKSNPKTLEEIMESLPEVQKEKGIWQNKFHEFDVYNHTMDFVKHIKDITSDLEMIAAAYLHDIGKPIVAKPKYDENGALQEREPGKSYNEFDDHEKAGEEMVKKMDSAIFNEYNLDKEKIAKLVGSHYIPMRGIKAMRKTKTFDEFKKAYDSMEDELGKTGYKSEVLTMFTADKLAQGKFCTDKEELFAIHDYFVSKKGSLENIYEMQKQMYGGKK